MRTDQNPGSGFRTCLEPIMTRQNPSGTCQDPFRTCLGPIRTRQDLKVFDDFVPTLKENISVQMAPKLKWFQ